MTSQVALWNIFTGSVSRDTCFILGHCFLSALWWGSILVEKLWFLFEAPEPALSISSFKKETGRERNLQLQLNSEKTSAFEHPWLSMGSGEALCTRPVVQQAAQRMLDSFQFLKKVSGPHGLGKYT